MPCHVAVDKIAGLSQGVPGLTHRVDDFALDQPAVAWIANCPSRTARRTTCPAKQYPPPVVVIRRQTSCSSRWGATRRGVQTPKFVSPKSRISCEYMDTRFPKPKFSIVYRWAERSTGGTMRPIVIGSFLQLYGNIRKLSSSSTSFTRSTGGSTKPVLLAMTSLLFFIAKAEPTSHSQPPKACRPG